RLIYIMSAEVLSGVLCDFTPGNEFGLIDVIPVGAAVAREPEQAVVRASPDGVHVLERRSKRVDDAANFIGVGLLRGFVAQTRGNGAPLAPEIGADGLPGLAAVRGLEEKIGSVKQDVRIDG